MDLTGDMDNLKIIKMKKKYTNNKIKNANDLFKSKKKSLETVPESKKVEYQLYLKHGGRPEETQFNVELKKDDDCIERKIFIDYNEAKQSFLDLGKKYISNGAKVNYHNLVESE